MSIIDAEYQFDRHKLTFYFEADKRIDFRELVSELFSQYKTRIWMQQVDTSALDYQDAGTELARATGFLPTYNQPATATTVNNRSPDERFLWQRSWSDHISDNGNIWSTSLQPNISFQRSSSTESVKGSGKSYRSFHNEFSRFSNSPEESFF